MWSTNCNLIQPDKLDDFSQGIFEQYEKEYSHLDGDGIYFQSATETHAESIDGIVIADAITQFVNKTAALFFEKYPNLELQFGLHATSVKKNLAYILQTDPRIHIIWKDLGAFPFSYIPSDIKTFDETKALEMIHFMKESRDGDLYVSGLVEDGMFEENVMYPVALFAEMLWNADGDIKNMMSDVALRNYVDFA